MYIAVMDNFLLVWRNFSLGQKKSHETVVYISQTEQCASHPIVRLIPTSANFFRAFYLILSVLTWQLFCGCSLKRDGLLPPRWHSRVNSCLKVCCQKQWQINGMWIRSQNLAHDIQSWWQNNLINMLIGPRLRRHEKMSTCNNTGSALGIL